MDPKRSKPDQYQLRFPPKMRDKLKRAADLRGRSMNAEIIFRLEHSFKEWPKINLPEKTLDRLNYTRVDQRIKLEEEITSFAIEAINRAVPAPGELHRDFSTTFWQLMSNATGETKAELEEEFKELTLKIRLATAPEKKTEE